MATTLHLIIVRPFKDTKENITTGVAEVGMLLVSSMLPLLVESYQRALVGDLFIYILMGSTSLNAVISLIFATKAVIVACKKRCYKNSVVPSC